MIKLLSVIMGIVTCLLLNGQSLTIVNQNWVLLYADLTNFLFGTNGLNATVETIFLIVWVQLPLLFLFSLFSTFLICMLGRPRYYVYSFLTTTIMLFFILDKLPIFNVILEPLDGMRFYHVLVNLFLFLIFFVYFSSVINKHKSRYI